jgi:dTDP-4-dehydrorhamnose reductase
LKVLVTGAGGQLGRSLPGALRGHDVVALAHAELDVTRPDAVRAALAAQRPDVVINAAAYNAVDRAESDASGAFLLNQAGPRVLALASAESGAALVHVSTDYVFDGRSSEPYDEDSAPHPLSVYGRSKLAGELAVREANPRHFVVRTAWLYHERGSNFPLTILELSRRGPVRVVDDQHGSPTYAPHLAAAIARLIETAAYGVWHLAGSGGTSWYGFTRALFDRLGVAQQLTPVKTDAFPRPAPRPAYAVLVSRRAPALALPDWREGMEAFARALEAR